MNRDGYLTVALAICCIAAVGVSATTLTTSLQQEPDEVVDIDYAKLPLGQDEGKSIRGAVKNEEGSPPDGGSEGDREDPEGASAADEGDQRAMGGGGSEGNDADQESDGDSGGEGGDSGEQSAGGGGLAEGGTGGPGEGGGTGPLSPLEQLWQLLADLLPWLLLLVALALAYRYRQRLLAIGLALAVAFDDDTDEHETTEARWPSEPPANEIHRAWLSMVDRLELDRPYARTPSECAAAALDADMDPNAVHALTDVFEEVRYGEKPVTDERKRRAREGLDRLGGGGTA